jgi:hypothetical protein
MNTTYSKNGLTDGFIHSFIHTSYYESVDWIGRWNQELSYEYETRKIEALSWD